MAVTHAAPLGVHQQHSTKRVCNVGVCCCGGDTGTHTARKWGGSPQRVLTPHLRLGRTAFEGPALGPMSSQRATPQRKVRCKWSRLHEVSAHGFRWTWVQHTEEDPATPNLVGQHACQPDGAKDEQLPEKDNLASLSSWRVSNRATNKTEETNLRPQAWFQYCSRHSPTWSPRRREEKSSRKKHR
jgi:hypothetical protein